MKKRFFKRVASIAIALTLVLGLFVVPEINVYAEEEHPTGFKEPVVETKDVTEEEFNELTDESQKADVETFVEKCYKGTDSFWYQFSSPYYNYSFSRLNANQRKLYDDLYSKLMAYVDGGADFSYDSAQGVYLTPIVKYTGLTEEEAINVAYLLIYDTPELYYLSQYVGVYEDSYGQMAVRLGVYDGMQTGTQRANYASQIKLKINWYLSQVSTSASAYDKEKTIHDLLCNNCYYGSFNTPFDQSCASVFLNPGGETVCAGYSEAFALLCYARGIPAMSITSAGHEWNQVKLGNYWYAVDVTWDDTASYKYKHFNKSDSTMLSLGRAAHTLEGFWSSVGRESCPYDYGSEPASGGTTWYNGIDYSAVYEYNYYINTYGDLRNAFGNDSTAAIAHFVNYGMNEGRQAKSTFDVVSYRNQYSDLRQVFGWNNLRAYYEHYMNWGIKESRVGTGCNTLQNPLHSFLGIDCSSIYNYQYYIDNNPDVKNAFGGDDVSIFIHFLTCGLNEGRSSCSNFNVYSYRNQNQDLRLVYGWDRLSDYYMHYLNYGRREGRKGTGCNSLQNPIHVFLGVDFSPVYDYYYYIEHNQDVKNAFGGDDRATFIHFLTNGCREGRQGCKTFNVWAYANNNLDIVRAYFFDLPSYYLHYINYGMREGRIAV